MTNKKKPIVCKNVQLEKIEAEMRFLFSLPMDQMSDNVVMMYNHLEFKWKKLTKWSV